MRSATERPQRLSLLRGHDPGGDVVVEREHGDGRLADRKGWSRNNWRQQTFETLAGFRQFGRNTRRTRMHLRTDVMRHQPNNALAVSGRQDLAGVGQRRSTTGRSTTGRRG